MIFKGMEICPDVWGLVLSRLFSDFRCGVGTVSLCRTDRSILSIARVAVAAEVRRLFDDHKEITIASVHEALLAGHEGRLVALGLAGGPLTGTMKLVAQQGRVGCGEILLALGADTRSHIVEVELAASGHHWRLVELLVRAGADPNGSAPGRLWTSPLHWAVRHPEVVRCLVSHGANPRALDRSGMTPMMRGIMERLPIDPTCAEHRMLMDYDMSHQDLCGRTTLALASLHGLVDLVKELASADTVNVTDRMGDTPLSIACQQKVRVRLDLRLEIIEALLSVSADPNLGYAAAHAARNGEWAVLRLLREAGPGRLPAGPGATFEKNKLKN